MIQKNANDQSFMPRYIDKNILNECIRDDQDIYAVEQKAIYNKRDFYRLLVSIVLGLLYFGYKKFLDQN